MIQTTPMTEPVSPGIPLEQAQRGEAVEESQKSKSGKNGLGVFAKILAGLTKKTGTGENAASVKNTEVPLAETTELSETLSADGAVSGGKRKGIHNGKAAATEKIKNQFKNGEVDSESLHKGLSDQEKNALLAVSRLTGNNENLNLEETEGAAVLKGLRDDLRRNGRETVHAETISAELPAGEKAGQPLTVNSAAFTAEELAENAKIAAEKSKNRLNSVETAAKNRQSAGEFGEYQRTEVKKTLPGEKEGKNKLEESRNRRRFEVHDFRTTDTAAVRVGAETRVSGEGSAKEITLELRLPNNTPESSNAATTWEAKAGQAFEDLLARELHQNFNNDIVRHASVALRDGNEGTIRLALKPESLGNVKIHLEMAENRITGHIVVETEEALRAFEREISSLEKAFRESGFEGANLEMSLAADGRGAENQWQEAEASPFLPGQFAASRYDAAVEWMETPLTLDIYQQGAGAINVLV